jgi:hypothetical protein
VLRPPQDVSGLEVSMHKAGLMEALEACGHVAEHLSTISTLKKQKITKTKIKLITTN